MPFCLVSVVGMQLRRMTKDRMFRSTEGGSDLLCGGITNGIPPTKARCHGSPEERFLAAGGGLKTVVVFWWSKNTSCLLVFVQNPSLEGQCKIKDFVRKIKRIDILGFFGTQILIYCIVMGFIGRNDAKRSLNEEMDSQSQFRTALDSQSLGACGYLALCPLWTYVHLSICPLGLLSTLAFGLYFQKMKTSHK